MMLSVLISRDPAQRLVARASWWAVGEDCTLITRVTVPCTGPMTSREALITGIRALLAELESEQLVGSAGGSSDAGQQH